MRRLSLLIAFAAFAVACGGESQDATPTPRATGQEQLGREIGETYLLLVEDTKAMLGLNLPAERLKPALRLLKEDYRVRFANLGCLRQGLQTEARLQVDRAAEDFVSANGGLGLTWLDQGSQRYAADSEIPALLIEIHALRVYASLDQLARLRPDEHILCN